MRLPRECYQMQQVIETHLPHLSRPQLTGLVLWVCGAVLAGSACQNAVASALSPRWNNLAPVSQGVVVRRQRPGPSLPDRTGRKSLFRPIAPVGPGLVAFRPVGWPLIPRGDQTTAIVISVVYLPFPWPGASTGPPRMDPIVELLRELAPAVPQEMSVTPRRCPGLPDGKAITFCAGYHPWMARPTPDRTLDRPATGGKPELVRLGYELGKASV